MKQFFKEVFFPGVVLLMALFLLLKKGAEYLVESGNTDMLVMGGSMFTAALISEILVFAVKNWRKNKADKTRATD